MTEESSQKVMWWQKLRRDLNLHMLGSSVVFVGCAAKMWRLQSCVFAWCILQHMEYLTWLCMGVSGFDVFLCFMLQAVRSLIFLSMYTPGLSTPNLVCGCIPLNIRTSMFLYVIYRFWVWSCWWMSKDVKSLRCLWVYFPIHDFWGALCGWHSECVSLSTLCVYLAEWRSLICLLLSSQNFRSLIGFGCPSQDLLSVSFLVAGIRWEVSDLLYIPGYKVCEWFVGVFCRISYLWPVWVCVLGCFWSVCISSMWGSVNICYSYVPGCGSSLISSCVLSSIWSLLICFCCLF